MNSKRKIIILMISLLVLTITPLAIVLPIVLKHQNTDQSSNATTISSSNITMMTTTGTTHDDVTIEEQSLTDFTLSAETLSSWKRSGTVFTDNGTLYPSHSQKWHVCGVGPSSSISRSIKFSTAGIAYNDEDPTQLKISGRRRGQTRIVKTPKCSTRSEKIDPIGEVNNANTASWESFNHYYDLCLEETSVEIIFTNGTACLEDIKIIIGNPPFP